MSVLSKAWACYREAGAAALARRIRRAVWSTEVYRVFRKSVEPAEWPARYDDVEFRTATVEDLPMLTRWWPEEFRYVGPDVPGVLRRRMEVGDVGIVGLATGRPDRPAFISWLSHRDYALMTLLGVPLPEGNICAKSIWVSDDFRRRQVALRGQRYAETVALERGMRTIWAFVLVGNAASCALHDKLGYERYGTVRFVERFGRRTATLERGGECRCLVRCPPGERVL